MKYMLIMRATDEAYAAYADVDFNEMLETMGSVQRGADGLRCPGRGRGPRRRGERCRRRLLLAAAGGHRRALRRDQGAVRRLLAPRRRLEGGGGRVGQAGPDGRAGHRRSRSVASPASTSSRRTTRRSRGSGRGGRRTGNCELGWLRLRPPGGRGGVADRVRPHRRAPWPATPATSRSPRTSPRRRWPRRWCRGRATGCRPTRPAGCSPPGAGGRSTPSAGARRSTRRYAALAHAADEARGARPGTRTGSRTTCWR